MPSNNLSNSVSSVKPFSKYDRWSMYFDGTNDNRINCGSDSSLDVGTKDFTISAWFRSVDPGSKDFWPIVSKGDSLGSGDGWAVTHVDNASHSNKIYFDTVTSSGGGTRNTEQTAADAVNMNQWHHVVCVCENSDDKMHTYVDGSLTNTANAMSISDITDGSEAFYIGNDGNSRDYVGYISDVAFYNDIAFTAGQVTTIYNNGLPYNHKDGIQSSKLKGWWRMGDGVENGTGSTIYDASGNNNDGTVENGPVFAEDSP
tara:strand:+ start:27 stop:800 length:774 start_codon:yes stop_codon:yes gene_type:complete